MQNAKKTFSVGIKFICQSMKFQFSGWFFFIFRYHWHNNFTSAIKSFNRSLNIFFDLWRVFFTSVASILCFIFHVFWSWHNIFTSAFIFAWCWHILFMSLQWFSLIFLYWHMFFYVSAANFSKSLFFSYHWHKNVMSATP